jgi:hypothetical protein
VRVNNKFNFFQDLILDLKCDDVDHIYSEVSLYSAIKRHLFTIAVNSKCINKCYFDIINNNVNKYYFFITAEEFDIAKMAFKKHNRSPRLFLINFKVVVFLFVYIIRYITNINRLLNPIKSQFCIFIHHPKFLNLANELFSGIEDKCSLLVPEENFFKLKFSSKICFEYLPKHISCLKPFHFRYFELSVLFEKYKMLISNKSVLRVITFEGDAAYNEILAILSTKLGCESICFQWGAFPWDQPKVGFRNFSHNYYLTWGEYFSSQLKDFSNNKFVEIGNPLIKSWVSLPTKRILFLHQGFDNVQISEFDYTAFWQFMLEISTILTDYEIIIRNHPNVPLTIQEKRDISIHKIKHHDPSFISLNDSFDGVMIGFTIMSSAIIEATASGIIPFIFNPNYLTSPFKPNFLKLKMGYESNDIVYLKNTLLELTNNFQELKNLKDSIKDKSLQLFYKVGDDSVREFQKFILNANINKE